MMRKQFMLAAGAVALAGVAFGYGNSDRDARQNRYDGSAYIRQAKTTSGSTINTALNDSTYWSDGKLPHGDGWYYIPNDMDLTLRDATWPSEKLVVGYGGDFLIYNGSVTVSNMQLRVHSQIVNWWAGIASITLNGAVTVLADGTTEADNLTYAPQITAGRGGCVFTVNASLTAPQGSYLRAQRFWNTTYGHDGSYSTLKLKGDNTAFQGTLSVGSDVHVKIGNGGLPNGIIDVNGDCWSYSKYKDTEIAYTSLGICASDENPVAVKSLVLADGSRLECDGLDANGGKGFNVTSSYQQGGLVTLDFGNVLPTRAQYDILTVPSENGLELSMFEMVNMIDSDCQLQIIDNTEAGTQTLALVNPNPKTYIKMTGPEVITSSTVANNTFKAGGAEHALTLYFGPGTWEDGLKVHDDGDYMVQYGEQIYFPINWEAMAGTNGAKVDGGKNKFNGKSLTINGGTVLCNGNNSANAKAYYYIVPNLILAGGATVRNDVYAMTTFAEETKITVKGTATIQNGNSLNSAANVSGMEFRNAFAGDGNADLTMLGDSQNPLPSHTTYFLGDASEYEGCVTLKKWNANTRFGRYGFPNGTFSVGDDCDPRASFGVTNINIATLCLKNTYIPFRCMYFNTDGVVIRASDFVNFNGGMGFKVTEDYMQVGKVVFDFANIPLTNKIVRLLSVPGSCVGSLENYVVSNLTVSGYALTITEEDDGNMAVALENPNVKNYIPLLGNDLNTQSSLITNLLVSGRGWADKLDPHADGDYLVNSGYTVNIPHNMEEPFVFPGDSLTIDHAVLLHPNWTNKTTSDITFDDLIVKAGYIRLGSAADTMTYGQVTFDSSAYPNEPNAIWYYTWTGRHDTYAKWIAGKDQTVHLTSGTAAKNGSPTIKNGILQPGGPETKATDGKYSFCKYYISYRLNGDYTEFLGTVDHSWNARVYLNAENKFAGTLYSHNITDIYLYGDDYSDVSAKKIISHDGTIYTKANSTVTVDELEMDWAPVSSHIVSGIDVYTGEACTDTANYRHLHAMTNKAGYASGGCQIFANRLSMANGATLKVGKLTLNDTRIDFANAAGVVEADELNVTGQLEINGSGSFKVGATGVGFTVNNALNVKNLELAAGKTLVFNGEGALNVTGTLTLGGKLVLDFTQAAEIAAGQTRTFLTASDAFVTATGGFENVTIETIGLPEDATLIANGKTVSVKMRKDGPEPGLIILFR